MSKITCRLSIKKLDEDISTGNYIVFQILQSSHKAKQFGLPFLLQKSRTDTDGTENGSPAKVVHRVATQVKSIAPIIISDFVIKLLFNLWMLLKIFICGHGTYLFLLHD